MCDAQKDHLRCCLCKWDLLGAERVLIGRESPAVIGKTLVSYEGENYASETPAITISGTMRCLRACRCPDMGPAAAGRTISGHTGGYNTTQMRARQGCICIRQLWMAVELLGITWGYSKNKQTDTEDTSHWLPEEF